MENCGIGACSADKPGCASAITSMVIDTLSGIVDAVSTVVTLGTAYAANTAKKAALKAGVDKLGKKAT